jgi:hypothetical protein
MHFSLFMDNWLPFVSILLKTLKNISTTAQDMKETKMNTPRNGIGFVFQVSRGHTKGFPPNLPY